MSWRVYVDGHVDAIQQQLVALQQQLAERTALYTDRIETLRREVLTAHNAATLAIEKSESATSRRLADMTRLSDNQTAEVRGQLAELAQIKANERLQVERVDSLRRETDSIRDASDKAIAKSEAAAEKRFESVNEFRAQLTDQAGRFTLREVSDATVTELRTQLDEVKSRLDVIAGRGVGSAQLWGFLVGAIGLLATIIVIANTLTR